VFVSGTLSSSYRDEESDNDDLSDFVYVGSILLKPGELAGLRLSYAN
jgi:hypothetical protein